jgi:N-acetylmuramoyl-L-alanine amidase
MAGYYVVKQGDHLSGIADAYGFPSYKKIWNHPNNGALKALRQNPNVLFPGDSVYIPDREEQSYSKPTDARHKFTLTSQTLLLKIEMDRGYAQPIANAPCELTVDGNRFQMASDGAGRVQHDISKSAVDATLVVKDKITNHGADVPLDWKLSLKIGYLDPVEEVSGQQARLSNLGYYRGDPGTTDPDEMKSAVEEFQCENNLQVDGICGPITQAKLKAVHGS